MPSPPDDTEGGPTWRTTINTGETPIEAVIWAVASIANRKRVTLPPIHETIEPDCLDMIFCPTVEGLTRTDGAVTFPFADYHVTVTADGDVHVGPIEEDPD